MDQQKKSDNDVFITVLDNAAKQDETQSQEYKEFMKDLASQPDSKEKKAILRRARDGTYSDFKSKLASPKMELRTDLIKAGFHDMTKKVVLGSYDF